jgi:arsenate reductase
VDGFRGIEFDYVITLCNHSRATCPFYPAAARFFHVGFADPAQHKGTEEESLTVFRRVRDEIKEWIERTFGDTRNGED